ncbi:hypothetical protein FAVG1_03355 [Fusarium avenaceum]|nr:hypothetical protein FAVG1_03355 [Fusarium avenaceum]
MGSNSLSQIDPSPLVVCYGALNDAAAQCLANTTVPEELHLTNCNGYHRFPITFKDGTCLLESRENESYAILDTHSTRKLAVLRELSSVKLEAITDAGNLLKRQNKKNRRQTFSVFVNIFGPQDVASDAASRLSKASAFLQHPKSLEPGIIYSNPQFFRIPGMDEDMNKYIGLGDRLSSQRKVMISAEIHDILCSLTRVESFQAGLPQGIQAILKPHQEDAFSFILQRETEAVCNNLQIGLQQVARVSNTTQPTSYGGIIADVMGLVVADHEGFDVLGQMNWYRVVLDEETHLNLPQSSEETIFLSFSPEEAKLYKAILEQSRREIDKLVSSAANIGRYNILFTAILKMRMLCNRGTLSPAGRTAYLLPQKPSVKYCDRPLQMSSLVPHSRLSPISDFSMENDMISPESTYAVEPHSTKLSSVVDNVSNHGIGAKHIVFSYWTSTLDALEQLFNTAGVRHVQIDGRTSYTERSHRLNKFREDPRVTVLLMSIETGVVHIVEPQWNPSVEEQAVARALRMGQTKEVKIFRYVMKSTVEENIIGLQKKKKKLATFTFGEDDEGAQEKLEDLKFVLNADVDQSTTTPDRTR